MSLGSRSIFWLRALTRRRNVEREMQREIAAHIAMEQEHLERSGLSASEAHRQTMIAFGGIERHKEAVRDERGTRLLGDLSMDFRYALRRFRHAPGFVVAVVGVLALGIGATATMFTIVDAVLLRPLPFPEADRIVSISDVDHGTDRRVAASTNINAWRREARSVEILAAYTSSSTVYAPRGADPVQLSGAVATSELFTLLGVHPVVGRAFVPAEMVTGGPNVVVLSREFWQQSFAGDSGIVGRYVVLDSKPYTVIGVVDEQRALPRTANYWFPLRLDAAGPAVYFYSVLARLKPGASDETVRRDLGAITRSLDASRPASQRGGDVAVMQLHDRMFGTVRKPLTMLFGAVTFLLLIACANVANLLLARGAMRRREIAVRLALGSGRWRVIRQTLFESLLLGGMSAGVGVLIALWAVRLFVRTSSETIARVPDIHVDSHVLLFAAVVGVTTGLLFGTFPAWASVSGGDIDSLKEGGARAGSSPYHHRVRQVLIVTELSLALLLLTGAGLLTRSFANVMAVDLGFQPEHLSAATVYLPRARYQDSVARRIFFESLLDRVRALPGIQSAALTDGLPPNGYAMSVALTALSGRPDTTEAAILTVGREFPPTVGLQLIAGRVFAATDGPGAPPAVLLSASAARALFPNGAAVGQQLPASAITDRPIPAVVVGVVKDVPLVGVDATPMPHAYFSREQIGGGEGSVVIRSLVDPSKLEVMIRHAVAGVDPRQPVAAFERIDEALAQSVAPRRLNFLLIDIFAGLALLLAGIGLYGVMSLQVTQRTREMGIRMALGATGQTVRALILRQGMTMVAIGCAIGILLSVAATRVLAGLLYGVGVHDAATFLLAPALLCAVAAVATVLPARRATTVDPMVALRND
jgi:predicted permease